MIDSSEERKRQLAFELQNSRVFEKRSKQVTQLDHCMMRKHVLVFKKIDSVFTLLTPRYWLFTNVRTLKFKSRLHNYVLRYRQS